jgi:hypothetical protein
MPASLGPATICSRPSTSSAHALGSIWRAHRLSVKIVSLVPDGYSGRHVARLPRWSWVGAPDSEHGISKRQSEGGIKAVVGCASPQSFGLHVQVVEPLAVGGLENEFRLTPRLVGVVLGDPFTVATTAADAGSARIVWQPPILEAALKP